ncbi:MAG: TRAP transporter small permease subunit [Pseudomonadota bacterium]
MFATVISAAFLRYGFSTGSVKIDDLQHYAFGALILFSIAAAFWSERHVKVEVFDIAKNRSIGERYRQFWLILLVFFPFGLLVFLSVPDVLSSWQSLEGSAEPNGLGGLFLLKTLFPFAAVLMVVLVFGKMFSLQDKSS